MNVVPGAALLNRMRCEFLEMPGLRLTREQAQRLHGVEQTLCQRALDTLLGTGFLCVTPDGMYKRRFEGADIPQPTPAKADLRPENSSVKAPA